MHRGYMSPFVKIFRMKVHEKCVHFSMYIECEYEFNIITIQLMSRKCIPLLRSLFLFVI